MRKIWCFILFWAEKNVLKKGSGMSNVYSYPTFKERLFTHDGVYALYRFKENQEKELDTDYTIFSLFQRTFFGFDVANIYLGTAEIEYFSKPEFKIVMNATEHHRTEGNFDWFPVNKTVELICVQGDPSTLHLMQVKPLLNHEYILKKIRSEVSSLQLLQNPVV